MEIVWNFIMQFMNMEWDHLYPFYVVNLYEKSFQAFNMFYGSVECQFIRFQVKAKGEE